MSTLVVSNISDGTTTVGASYVTNGSAKVWVNFNGTGTVAIRDSLNVSSITDRGTGAYTINANNAMSDANFSWVGSACNQGTAYGAYVVEGTQSGTANFDGRTASTVQVNTGGYGAWADSLNVGSVFNGDLA